MFVGVLIGIIVFIDVIIGCIQSYRKKRNKRRAEEYRENDEQSINLSRRSTGEQAIHQVPDADDLYSAVQTQNAQKNKTQPEYSNIQNNHPDESKNNTDRNR